MRVVKEHNERKKQILDEASRLFAEKGYDKCTVNDILKAVDIAKGTFYHYFKSKEEVLDAITQQAADMIEAQVKGVMEIENLTPEERVVRMFTALSIESQMPQGLATELHHPENALLHQRSLKATVNRVTPLFAEVVEQGNEQDVFKAEYPHAYMKIFLTASTMLLDDGVFQVEPEEQEEMLQALFTLFAKMVGISGDKVNQLISQYMGQ